MILNLFSISLKLNFEIIRTPGSFRSVISSTCTSGLVRPLTGDSFEILGEWIAAISLFELGKCDDEMVGIRDVEASDVSLIIVKSLPFTTGINESLLLLWLFVLVDFFLINLFSGEGVTIGESGT